MADGFKINKSYADKYNIWRQKEELQKLKDRYGEQEESGDSSSSESEDEDAECLTEQLDKDWLRTLSALKSKDPKIYQKDVTFYHDDDNEVSSKSNKKSKDKPMFLKDYERKVILEKDGIVNEDEGNHGETSYKTSVTYHQEQEELRKRLVAAAGDDDSSDDEDDDDDDGRSDNDDTGLLKKREKTTDEKQKEDFEYLEWLKGQKPALEKDKHVGKDLAPLKNYWEKKDLDAGEKFLKNYILNRQYIDNDDDDCLPTYDDIVNDEEENFSDEEELLVKQDSFERKYNFRFEEPDAADMKTYPRNFEETVRRKDTKRADKRKETKERKLKEKEKKKDELKQLKNLKRQEIMDKIEKLKQITGNKKLGFDEDDLDEDFDPKKHDEMMENCFDNEYYDTGDTEEVKPVFAMSDDETEDWDNWTGDGKDGGAAAEGYDDDWNQAPDVDDPDFIMDADYDPEADRQRKKTKKEKKSKKKLAQALRMKKPVFDPNEKTFEEYFDEYYKLDYEDIIDDMPCRFKYRKVTPNSFGLTTDEILNSRDKELNAWVSVKKMSQYRTEEEEQHDLRVYESKGKNVRKKENILTSLFKSDKNEEEPEVVNNLQPQSSETKQGKKKRKRKKGKKKQTNNANDSQEGKQGDETSNTVTEDTASTNNTHYESKNKSVKLDNAVESDPKQSDKQVNETGINVNHGKKRKITDESVDAEDQEHERKIKKKKKRKSDNFTELKADNAAKSDSIEGEKASSSNKNAGDQNSVSKDSSNQGNQKDSRKKKNKKKNKGDKKPDMSEERLKAYGINPKRYKYIKKDELFQVKPRKNKQFS